MINEIKRSIRTNITVVLALILIVFPKINFILIPGFAQGVRLDDIIIMFMLIAIFLKNIEVKIESLITFLFIVLCCLVGLINNPYNELPMRVLGILRFTEYFIALIFFTGHHFTPQTKSNLAICTLGYLAIVSVIQWIFVDLPLGRTDAFLGGPWESSLISLFCFSYILAVAVSPIRRAVAFILCAICIGLAQARMPMMAFILVSTIHLITFVRSSRAILVSVAGLATILVVLIFSEELDLRYFNYNKAIHDLIENSALRNFWTYVLEPWYFHFSEFENSFSDKSLGGRLAYIIDYSLIFHSARQPWLAFIIGNGFHSGGLHLDSLFVKIFVDLGLVGILLFVYALAKLCSNGLWLLAISIAISSLTFDVIWASKVAYALIFLLAARSEK